MSLTVVLPHYNEGDSLQRVLPAIRAALPDCAIIVVDDGSRHPPADACARYDARLIRHPYNKGNGAAIKTGAREAHTEFVAFMDADGQHDPAALPLMLSEARRHRYDMVVAARPPNTQAGLHRRLANGLYNRLASWITGQQIQDLTSGFRLLRRAALLSFLHLLPNGFSSPTTLTIAFFRAGYNVHFLPMAARPRTERNSHIRPLRDGIRFLIIIFRIGTLYSPLKVFVPASLSIAAVGVLYYLYTFSTQGRFTNMGVMLLVASIMVFLIGLVSEQITNLLYSTSNTSRESRED